MALFRFKAVRATGEMYESVKEAPDEHSLYEDLKSTGDSVVFAEPADKSSSGGFFGSVKSNLRGVSMMDKIGFARNLSAMISAGLAMPRALAVLERQTKNYKFKKTIETISSDIKEGKTLHESLAKFPKIFSSLFVAMAKAGEEGGTLASSLKTVGNQMNQTYLLEKRIRGALIYPAILVTLMIIIAVLMLTFVVPSLTATFKDLHVELPLSTRVIIAVSDFMKDHVILVFIGLIIFVAGIVSGLRLKKVKRILETIFLKLPVIGRMVVETNTARTARTLSSLLASGVSAVSAIEITTEVVQNHNYKKVLAAAGAAIQKGEPLYKVFVAEEKLYPAFFIEMIGIGEETGKLNSMLVETADFYEEEIERQTKDLSSIIEPVLMIIVGAVVGIFAVSMITPIYSLSSAIS